MLVVEADHPAGRRGIVRQPEEKNCKQIESKIKIENQSGFQSGLETALLVAIIKGYTYYGF